MVDVGLAHFGGEVTIATAHVISAGVVDGQDSMPWDQP